MAEQHSGNEILEDTAEEGTAGEDPTLMTGGLGELNPDDGNDHGDIWDGDDLVTDALDGDGGGPGIIGPPPSGNPPDRIPGNNFAGPYRSSFTNLIPEPSKSAAMELLTNVNCNYLSTPGFPPTLKELKQHAQALTVLIKKLTVSTSSALVDNMNSGFDEAAPFHDGQTYDWLNNLSLRYNGPIANQSTHHDMPITNILNNLRPQSDLRGNDDICPLYSAPTIPPNAPSLPYVTHQALIKHANDVLELLDHEYSAKGGLQSILPPETQLEDRKEAEQTLLGQWIIYTNQLVERLHSLERLYANSMDVLAGEAAVPFQTLSRLGPDGRAPRELVYPQDRFVLVNAGEDVWQFLNSEFERKERADEKADELYRRQGTTGEAIWARRGGKEYSRGITAIDVVTRYYRLRKDALKTIFVIPAHAEHPGTKVTRDIESKPTVVNVVKPVWPERHSKWEMENRAKLDELKTLRVEHMRLEHELEVKTQAEAVLKYDNDRNMILVHDLQNALALPGHEQAARIVTLTQELNEHNTRHTALQAERDRATQQLADDRAALDADRVAFSTERDTWRRQQTEATQDLAARRQAFRENSLATDQLQRDAAQDFRIRLMSEYKHQIRETIILKEILRRAAVEVDYNELDIPPEIQKQADEDTTAVLDRLIVLHEQAFPSTSGGAHEWHHHGPRQNQSEPPPQPTAESASGDARGFGREQRDLGKERWVRFQDMEEDDDQLVEEANSFDSSV